VSNVVCQMKNSLVIVPLYRNPELILPLFTSFIACKTDFSEIGARLLLIVDSPDDEPLRAALAEQLPLLHGAVPTEVLINERNLGFLRSANKGFDMARDGRRDAIIMNSDTVLFPGALTEMRAVAYSDHMIGFVSPRSNNATLCSLPNAEQYRHRSVTESFDSFNAVAPFLPRIRYVPTAVGFCMYIKWLMLEEFGGFDPAYNQGYCEENDFIMRANRCGYRAALANHAFVYHVGEKSFSLTSASKEKREFANAKLLDMRYPEYMRGIRREARSAEVCAERVLSGLMPNAKGQLAIAFDWTNIGLYHNGTFEAASSIVRYAAEKWRDRYEIVLIGNEHSAEFHGLLGLENISVVSEADAGTYSAIIRIGQPFHASTIPTLCHRAPIVAVYMLDTIALDCQYLDQANLADVWQQAFYSTDLVVYISRYTQQQFRARYRIPDSVIEVASLLSVNVDDYAPADLNWKQGDAVLIVGNQFSHKHVDVTVRQILTSYPAAKVVVLGSTLVQNENVRVYESGNLTPDVVDALYRDARVVLFPSHYEGFGLPILHALARRRPIIVRAMPLNDELCDALNGSPNIHQRDSTAEMVKLACTAELNWVEPEANATNSGWHRVVDDLDKGLQEARDNIQFSRLVERFERVASTESAESALAHRAVYSIGVTRRISQLTRVAAVMCAIVVAAFSVALAFRGYSAIPFYDQWLYVDPQSLLDGLFKYHNEHRAVISKLLFWADAKFFSSANVSLYLEIYAIQAAHVVLLIYLAMFAGLDGPVRRYVVVAAAICFLFGTQNYENLTWGFQTQFVLVFAAATAAVVAFASYLNNGRSRFLAASVIAASVCSLEMANGVAIFPILLGMAAFCRARRPVVGIMAIATLFFVLLAAFTRGNLQSNPAIAVARLDLTAGFVLSYLGSFMAEAIADSVFARPIGLVTGAPRIWLSITIGACISAIWLFSAVQLYRGRKNVSIGVVGLVAVHSFVVASALITAIGRVGFGLEMSFSSRYAIGSGIASVIGILLALHHVGNGNFNSRIRLQLAVLVMLAIVAFSQGRFLAQADERRVARDLATTGLYVDTFDRDAYANMYADPKFVQTQAGLLRNRHASVFADPRSELLGSKDSAARTLCSVTVDEIKVMADGSRRVAGTISLNPLRLRPPMILILDDVDRVVGFGFASLRYGLISGRSWLGTQQAIAWQGHLTSGSQGPFHAIDLSRCDGSPISGVNPK
jgi:GT2 family glycosyltransferase/glycosyltransferase involved in cell wall biosynthesis